MTDSVLEARLPDFYQKATIDNRQPEFIRKQERVTDTTIEARQPDFYGKAGKSDEQFSRS